MAYNYSTNNVWIIKINYKLPVETMKFLPIAGTLAAACKVLKELKVKIHECIVVIELAELKGREKVSTPIFSLLTF